MVFVGTHKSDLPTPALCLDLESFDSNLAHISQCVESAGKGWRPHSTCHHSVPIALRQLKQGVIGLTCARISAAEIFVAAGAASILLTHLDVGGDRIQRIARLAGHSDLIVSCDHYLQADQLSGECVQRGANCRVLVEVNVGLDRTGVRPGHDTLELARGIDRLPGLQLAGFMGYEGHAMTIADREQRRKCAAALGILSHTRELFQQNGLCSEIISAGGSGSLFAALDCQPITEIQAGTAVFGKCNVTDVPIVNQLKTALTLLTTVVSRPAYNRAVLDAGYLTIGSGNGSCRIKGWPDAKVARLFAEQTVLELGPDSLELRIGDQVELIPDEPARLTSTHTQYLCLRHDRLEEIWPISARDMIT